MGGGVGENVLYPSPNSPLHPKVEGMKMAGKPKPEIKTATKVGGGGEGYISSRLSPPPPLPSPQEFIRRRNTLFEARGLPIPTARGSSGGGHLFPAN